MLNKVLKYEFKSLSRRILPLAFASIGIAVLSVLLSFAWGLILENYESPLLSSLYFLYETFSFIAISVLSVITEILIIARYYKNFFTDEGYLTFTLPVTPECHITGKLISGAVWTFICSLVTLISVAVALSGFFFSKVLSLSGILSDLRYVYSSILYELGLSSLLGSLDTIDIVASCIEYVLIFLLSVISQTLLTYLAVSLGCMIAKKHKIIACIGMFFIVNAAISWIRTALSTFIVASYTVFSKDPILMGHVNSCITIVLSAILSVVSFLIIRNIIKNKLNLE